MKLTTTVIQQPDQPDKHPPVLEPAGRQAQPAVRGPRTLALSHGQVREIRNGIP